VAFARFEHGHFGLQFSYFQHGQLVQRMCFTSGLSCGIESVSGLLRVMVLEILRANCQRFKCAQPTGNRSNTQTPGNPADCQNSQSRCQAQGFLMRSSFGQRNRPSIAHRSAVVRFRVSRTTKVSPAHDFATTTLPGLLWIA
jgi:hypothetical protein